MGQEVIKKLRVSVLTAIARHCGVTNGYVRMLLTGRRRVRSKRSVMVMEEIGRMEEYMAAVKANDTNDNKELKAKM